MSNSSDVFTSSVQKVEDQWIDYNGHFNMAYYGVLFDRACDQGFALVGLGPEYVKETNCSFFTLETHTNYVRELHAGDEVTVTVQFLDYDAKRIHYIQEMHHASEGWLAATMEALCMHVDMTARKSAPFPDDIRNKIATMYEDHKDAPIPPQAGRRVGIVRKTA
jgi:acyl-CoA thioester hydrolase